jgi:uncharacterized protein YjbI with pentapeptide repeats
LFLSKNLSATFQSNNSDKLILTKQKEICMADSTPDEGLKLLQDELIDEFNKWRMKNLTVKLSFDNLDLSNKNLSNAYLNGVSLVDTNLSRSILVNANLVQSSLTRSNFDESDLTNALIMYSSLSDSVLTNSTLVDTNFMWSDLQKADLRGSVLGKTIFVEANLTDAKTDNLDKSKAYLKFSKLSGTTWE